MTSQPLPAALTLVYHDDILCLVDQSDVAAGKVWVDFDTPELRFRRHQALSREFLVKAVGGSRPRQSVKGIAGEGHIIDATAGLGQDAFILACAGWRVTMLEQSATVHALLADGLQRAARAEDKTLRQLIARMTLCEPGNAITQLAQLPPAEVIYLDPMFPERDKSARVKKNRALLQRLHGEEGQGKGLLDVAVPLTSKVVVKRPRLAPPLNAADAVPSAQISGKTSRFDIYVGQVGSNSRSIMRS